MRLWMRIGLVCAVVALATFGSRLTSQAQQPEESSYQAMSDKFFDMLRQDQATAAVDYMFSTNPALKKVPDQAEQLKTQFGSLRTLMGPYISHTKLAETKVAGMFVYQHYFVAYDRQPISVRIKYYKPGATWVCYGLQFDANLTDHIQTMADEKMFIDVK